MKIINEEVDVIIKKCRDLYDVDRETYTNSLISKFIGFIKYSINSKLNGKYSGDLENEIIYEMLSKWIYSETDNWDNFLKMKISYYVKDFSFKKYHPESFSKKEREDFSKLDNIKLQEELTKTKIMTKEERDKYEKLRYIRELGLYQEFKKDENGDLIYIDEIAESKDVIDVKDYDLTKIIKETLNEHEYKVFILRSIEEVSFEEIGKGLGMSKQGARFIYNKCIDKLSKNKKIKEIYDVV